MSTKKTNQAKTPELSPAVMAHQTTVRRLFQEAIESGRMTEQQLQNCLEHADGTPWDEIDHSKQAKWDAINVDVVWQTYDYNAFRLVPGLNRDVDHWKRIVASLAKADLMSPIIVNEAMEIIDGQNRFFARRYLGLPILYIEKPHYGPTEMRLYNNDSKNWTKADFIQSYSSEGREPYELLQQLYINYPRLSKAIIDQCAFGGVAGRANIKTIARGQLEAIDFEACTKTLDRLMGWAKFPNAINPSKDILHSPAWCRAWLTLVQKNPDTFDPARLFRKAVTYPAYIYPLGSVKATCEILVKLYNKDARVPTNLKY